MRLLVRSILDGIQINKRGGDINSFCEKQTKSEDEIEKHEDHRRFGHPWLANRDTPILEKSDVS